MHLGDHRARMGARVTGARPETSVWELLVQILADGERVPDPIVAMLEQRKTPGRRQRFERRHVFAFSVYAHFAEGRARLAQREAGAHGPGRIIVVPDIE